MLNHGEKEIEDLKAKQQLVYKTCYELLTIRSKLIMSTYSFYILIYYLRTHFLSPNN